MQLRKLLLATTISASALSANAAVTLDSLNTKMSPEERNIYLLGVSSGYSWANSYLEKDGKDPLFCVPRKLSLNSQNYLRIFENEIEENPHKPEEYVELIFMMALKNTFPCK